MPARPTRRLNRRRQAVIAGLGFLVCLGLFCWASFWLWPPTGACIILLGAGYEDNLTIPHNAYGRRSLQDLVEVSSSPNTAFFWGSRQLRLKHEPRELRVGDGWNEDWTDLPEKTLVVYLACHGGVDSQGAYLLPQDAGTRPEDRLRLTTILDRLATLPADKKKVLILDATQFTAHWPLGLLHNDFARELDKLEDQISAVPNLVVLSASDAEQRSWACPEWRQTIFAHYIIEGLKGAAADDDKDGLIDAWELYQFVRTNVERWVRDNRAAAQTPVLLPRGPLGQRRAVHADLTMTRSYEPPDPQQAPIFDPPSQLVKGWENFGRLERQVPSPVVYTPHTWRQYQDTLLRSEQLVRAGDGEHARILFDRLGDLDQEMSRARDLQLNCVQNSLPMPAAAGAGIPGAETLAAPFQELWETPPQEFVARWNGLQASNPATGPRDREFLRLQFSDFLLQRAAEDPGKNLEKAVDFLRAAADPINPRPAEIHFLSMLRRDLPADRPPPTEVLQLALRVRRLAEQAALAYRPGVHPYSETVAPWIEAEVKAGDQQRRLGEDLLFAGDAASWERSRGYLQRAERFYQQAQGDGDVVREAVATRDRVLAALPYYSQWLARQRLADNPLTQVDEAALFGEVEELWRNTHQLIALLEKPSPESLPRRSGGQNSLADRTQLVARSFDRLAAQFAAHCQDLAAVDLQSVWRDIDDALVVPMADARLRMRLLTNLARISRRLLIETDQESRDAVIVPPPSDGGSAKEGAGRQGRMALAVLGQWLFDANRDANQETYDQVRHRLQTFAVEANWWESVTRAGEQIGERWRQMPITINQQLVTAKQPALATDPQAATNALRSADRRARFIDGAGAQLLSATLPRNTAVC